MGFDLSKLTSAVNRYLNSISDVSAAARKASEEAESKALFGKELQVAIKQNIESHMDEGKMADASSQMAGIPDIEGQIKSRIDSATSGIKSTFDQIDGGFEAIKAAGSYDRAVDLAKGSADAGAGNGGKGTSTSADAALASLLGASGDTTTLASLLGSSGDTAATLAGLLGANADASLESFRGVLKNAGNAAGGGSMSLEELQDLSKSRYFTTNLLQSDLFGEGGSSDDSGSGDSMLPNLVSGTGSSEAVSSSLASALLKAYKSSGTKNAVTSVFGDFSL